MRYLVNALIQRHWCFCEWNQNRHYSLLNNVYSNLQSHNCSVYVWLIFEFWHFESFHRWLIIINWKSFNNWFLFTFDFVENSIVIFSIFDFKNCSHSNMNWIVRNVRCVCNSCYFTIKMYVTINNCCFNVQLSFATHSNIQFFEILFEFLTTN